MATEVIVGLLSLAGTAIGSLTGILAANKLVNFRLNALETKVDKHNNVIERTYRLEENVKELTHDIEDIKRRLD